MSDPYNADRFITSIHGWINLEQELTCTHTYQPCDHRPATCLCPQREVISLHVGQAGAQMGDMCWRLFCLEHDIDPDGCHRPPTQPWGSESDEDDLSFSSAFREVSSGRYRARAVFLDTEPTVLQGIRRGGSGELFDSGQLVAGLQDASNCFANGYYSAGRGLLPPALEEVRRQVEHADSLQGFMVFHSYGGGTGSGFTSLLMERLAIDYPKLVDLRFAVMPSAKVSSAVVEPYNAVLTAHNSLQFTDVCFVVDNAKMHELAFNRLAIDRPTFKHINSIISQTVSSVTGSLRFKGALNMSLAEICTNLVPFPRLHFLLTDYAPLVPPHQVPYNTFATSEITEMCFQESSAPHRQSRPDNSKLGDDSRRSSVSSNRDSLSSDNDRDSPLEQEPVFMACSLMYRGLVSPADVTAAIKKIIERRTVKFVSWTPTGFKVGINYQPVVTVPGLGLSNVPRSVCQLSNTTAAAHDWDSIALNFDKMYGRRAFLFWYLGQGMEETEMEDARENVAALQKDYDEIREVVPREKSREAPVL